jgi:hypothetical protein
MLRIHRRTLSTYRYQNRPECGLHLRQPDVPEFSPPERTRLLQQVCWASQTDGFFTGTEGRVRYTLWPGADLTLSWNNPYIGSNSFGCTAPTGFKCVQEPGTGGGYTAYPVFYLQYDI